MNRGPKRLAGGFVDGFTQGGMGMDAGFDLLVSRFEREGQAKFGNHLSRFGADDVRAEQFAVLFAKK